MPGIDPSTSVAAGGRRLPKGQRDRFGIARDGCASCGCDFGGGVVVLFYAYVTVEDPKSFADRVRSVCEQEGITCKIRIAHEGINSTAAGSREGIDRLIQALKTDEGEPEIASACKDLDYKKQPGCSHLFDAVSVRVVPEIVPFDDTNARPLGLKPGIARGVGEGADVQSNYRSNEELITPIEHLDSSAFHEEAKNVDKKSIDASDDTPIILDVRNWYESRIGHFKGATLAPIRRFSQLPEWIDRNPSQFKNKRVLMYCTGGVRCEKASAYLANLDSESRPKSIAQLKGGIAAYARDIASGTDGYDAGTTTPDAQAKTSLYVGQNFVFDNRGSTKVTDEKTKCGWCDGCGQSTNRVDACASAGCHTLLLVCETCSGGDESITQEHKVHCCESCEAQHAEKINGTNKSKRRRPCDCDGFAARERRLRAR